MPRTGLLPEVAVKNNFCKNLQKHIMINII